MARTDFKQIANDIHGRPSRAGRWLLLTIFLLLGVVAYWAHTTEIDDVTRANARIVPSQELQVVQAAESGTITEILVQTGDIVQAGQVLLRLDPTLLRAQLDEAQTEAIALRIRQARLMADIDGTDFTPPAHIPQGSEVLLMSEQQLFTALKRQLQADLKVLETRRGIRLAEIEAAKANIEVTNRNEALLQEELAVVEPLVKERVESPLALISLRRQISEQTGRRSEAQSRINSATAALSEIEDQRDALLQESLSKAHQELTATRAQLQALDARIPALQARLARSEIRAPTRGVVNQVLFGTIGGVAQQGQTVVEIVPIGDALTAEAYVAPEDIAFIRPDQPVKVRLTAYDSSRYGALDGRVLRIGADTVVAPDGESNVFIVDIRILGTLTDASGQPLDIIPGMVAQIDMLSEPKTVLAYLTQPVIRVKDNAFRD
ncbi:MAG: HlyD family type I secretion periplasmic adaptor subunit [Pseudomonadota bacterium]